MPKVSVIIPTYNRSAFISKAVSSVLKQTYRDYEIIIIDDGSTDATAAIIERFNGDKIKYIYQSHKGRSSARNKGVAKSNGDYIAFLDSDDVWLPEKLAIQVKAMDDTPKCGLAYTDAFMEDINGDNIEQRSKKYSCPSGDVFAQLYNWNFISTSTSMIRREIVDSCGLFNEEFGGAEDYDLWLRIAAKHEILFIDKILARYCYHMWFNQDYKIHVAGETIKVLEYAYERFPLRRKEIEGIKAARINSLRDAVEKYEARIKAV